MELFPPEDAAVEPAMKADGAAVATAGKAGVEPCPAPGTGDGLVTGLLHRYNFSGRGDLVCDLAGGAHGTTRGGAVLDGSGQLVLDGSDDYVALPSGMVSDLESVTVLVWFEWRGQTDWERVFDFGQTAAGDGHPGTSVGHFFFTPLFNPGPGSSVNFSVDGSEMFAVDGTQPFPREQWVQVAVVFDGQSGHLASYLDGVSQGQQALPRRLGELVDANCWLGQSQWSHDPHLKGRYDELRIYARALDSTEIAVLLEAGPDQP